MERRKRVAIYARVSSAGQAKRDLSIPDQVRLVTEFCENRGWSVVAVYQDRGKSGAETANRPEFQRMIRAACARDRTQPAIWTRPLRQVAN
jgi:site-specific DNA recombinase